MLDESRETIQSEVSNKLLKRHLNSFMHNDLHAVMLDYTEESVFITQEATYTGLREIEGFFANLIIHFPEHESKFELDKMIVKDELGFIVWHANTPSLIVSFGTDTFIIKNEKIYQQTSAGQLNFIN